jgi:sulfatase maturation enzyme AslB (radical SAM superfamily)
MINLYKFETIKKIEIDCTSFCNAFCGACDRNIRGGRNVDEITLAHLSLDNWYKLITKENLQFVNEIIFNGNFGDFSMHPKFIEMMEYLATVKTDIYINLNTNGGARDPVFWSNLATVLQKFSKHDVKFGIDGLEDTHDLYRRGILWKKRVENLKAFNDCGGNSIWKCIVFDYNISQLDDISNFAKNIGCMAFQTNRNRSIPLEMDEYKSFPKMSLTSPTLSEFNEKYKRKDVFKKQVSTPITGATPTAYGKFHCPYASEGMIQVDPWGNIWPCCYISGRQIDRKTNFDYNKYFEKNNISTSTFIEILDIFREDLYNAWEQQSIDVCNNCSGIKKPTPVY